jgi:aquaporin Z
MHPLDATFYVIAHFVGGALGVLMARGLLGADLASPSVRYVVTVPGRYGNQGAFFAECFMGLLMMTAVLQSANRARLSRFTWLLVGLLVATYVIAFSPVSGFSLNPARTVSSALFADVWTAMWLYLSAPLIGMLLAASLYVLTSGKEAVLCAKIFHDLHSPCPFRCRFRQLASSTQPASTP